jgi:protease-4
MNKGPIPVLLIVCTLALPGRGGLAAQEQHSPTPWGFTSVGTTDDGLSLFGNPAGLGLGRGAQAWLLHAYGERDSSAADGLVLSIGGLGLGAERWAVPGAGHSRRYSLGWGSKLGRNLYFGDAFRWVRPQAGSSGRLFCWDLGFILRPTGFLSLGALAGNVNEPRTDTGRLRRQYTLGIGLRPFGDRVTLFAEGRHRSGDDFSHATGRYGAEVELLKGLMIQGARDREGSTTVGLRFNLPRAGAGVFHRPGSDDNPVGGTTYLVLSQDRYRTAVPSSPGILEIALSGRIEDERPGFSLLGERPQRTTRELLETIHRAQESNDVSGLLIKLGDLKAGLAKTQEIRAALADFRSRGKKVYVYLDAEMVRGRNYLLASAADRVIMSPLAYLDISGLRAEVTFLKGMLEKLGIVAELEHIAEYKSFSDVFTRDSMSEAHREVVNSLLDDLYADLVRTIAAGRKMDPDDLRQKMDVGYYGASAARIAGFVDTLAYADELEGILQIGESGRPRLLKERDFTRTRDYVYDWGSPPRIAVIYAAGSIFSGESSTNPLLGEKIMGSRTIARAIRAARDDRSIRAIVLRIDSGGGSGFASNQIWREVELTRGKKPFVVSMSDVAGSGGYLIACAADTIVAEPGSITGSIGIVAGKVNLRGLYDKIGVNKEIVTRGKHADAFSSYRGFTPEERERLRREMRFFYEDFVHKVARGRNMTDAAVDSIGKGRVWTGSQARNLGLVDELGGLDLALRIAKSKARIPDDAKVEIVSLPKGRGWFGRGPGWLLNLGGDGPGEAALSWDPRGLLPEDRILAIMPFAVDFE